MGAHRHCEDVCQDGGRVKQVGSFLLTDRSTGLFYLRLVLAAYGQLAWSFVLAVENRFEGVFAEKGARFRGKGGLGAPPAHPFSWAAVGVLLKIPGGGGSSTVKPPPPPKRKGGRGEVGGGGGAEAPFTLKTSPFFGENAFLVFFLRICSFLCLRFPHRQ